MADMAEAVSVRPFTFQDVPELHAMMRELAAFEDYLDDFAVTQDDIIAYGLRATPPSFRAWIAEAAGELIGMAVTYQLPWTYDRKPRIVLKELFVRAHTRGKGAGFALMSTVQAHATALGASGVSWTVMDGNEKAETFYARLDGSPDAKWNNWRWDRS